METKELKNKLKELCGDDDERYNNEIEIFDFVVFFSIKVIGPGHKTL